MTQNLTLKEYKKRELKDLMDYGCGRLFCFNKDKFFHGMVHCPECTERGFVLAYELNSYEEK